MSEKRKIIVDGQEFEVDIELIDGKWEVTLSGKTFIVESDSAKRHFRRARESESISKIGATGTISSAIPGKVVSILVSEGDSISAGDVVLVLEAMKMQNEIKATIDGVVSEIKCDAGERVEANVPLLEIIPENM
ncbi:MAG: biotin/lipoyl-containing protein [Candidatus Thalassarchaeaceae archaeon]|jgi:biotin carboxyl carrier protein|nr:biotin/lipoyl-containing protein [Candidatus Thalassarchaeaceae archaeon]MEE2629328.1 biotin/lipoyl-containing protein [Candidatus Thermoplasmatota archaeon]